MKSTKLIATLLALVMVLSCMLMACSVADESSSSDASTAAPEQSGSSENDETTAPTGGDDATTAPTGGDDATTAPGDGGNGEPEQPEYDPNTLAITVDPDYIDFPAGDEDSSVLLLGVSANIPGVEVRVDMTQGDGMTFDPNVKNTYTIYYTATYFGVTVSATRTIDVLEALPRIVVEAQKSGDVTKWPDTYFNYLNKEYHNLTEAPADILPAQSGVFHNTSENPITLSVAGTYGVAFICDENGKVIEGRDGPNSYLVNEAHPVRGNGCPTELPDDGGKVADNFAKNLLIPAGGFAVVHQQAYYGGVANADADGRNFINYSVINKYGNLVSIYMQDDKANPKTEYLDQKPSVSGDTVDVTVKQNTAFDLNAMIWNNLTITDDNGTFDLSDDVTYGVGEHGLSVEVLDNGGFNIANVGTYTVSLKVTDANGNEHTFDRKVVVTAEDLITLTFCGQTWQLGESKVGINKQLNTTTKDNAYDILVYDKANIGYLSTSVLKVPGHAVYLRVNQYGEVVEIYDAPNGGRYTLPSDADKWGVHKAEEWKGNDVPVQVQNAAVNSLADGDILVVAVCDNACNSNINSHSSGDLIKTFLAARSQKDQSKWVLTMTGMTFATKPVDSEGE